MKIQTFSCVIGNTACNAHCPFCVSKMTMTKNTTSADINWRNLDKACRLAQQHGVSTALITGKGEPTLYIGKVIETIKHLNEYFPLVELQTNGYNLFQSPQSCLEQFYKQGLTTVIISMVHYAPDKNNKIYQFSAPLFLNLLISSVHDAGLSVRLSCIMLKGYIDSIEEVGNLLAFSKENKVEQLTIRSVEVPEVSKNYEVYEWTKAHKIENHTFELISQHYDLNSKLVMNLAHGAKVYDHQGQNLCISNCLTLDPDPENIRQLIYFPDGHLYYDWTYPGALLL
jgi:molybdenum cofactor biosynthesis enzyme MoaA